MLSENSVLLVFNGGSSSLKLKLYTFQKNKLAEIFVGSYKNIADNLQGETQFEQKCANQWIKDTKSWQKVNDTNYLNWSSNKINFESLNFEEALDKLFKITKEQFIEPFNDILHHISHIGYR